MAHRVAGAVEADLDDIWLYVAKESGMDIANRLVDSITRRFIFYQEGRGSEHQDLSIDGQIQNGG
jgi:hypothetical protein